MIESRSVFIQLPIYFFIDHKVREIIHLVASVCLSVRVCESYVVHPLVDTSLHCAPLAALCTMVRKGGLCPWEVGVTHNIFHFLMGHMEHAKKFCPYLVHSGAQCTYESQHFDRMTSVCSLLWGQGQRSRSMPKVKVKCLMHSGRYLGLACRVQQKHHDTWEYSPRSLCVCQ